jgi:hypothetical protein
VDLGFQLPQLNSALRTLDFKILTVQWFDPLTPTTVVVLVLLGPTIDLFKNEEEIYRDIYVDVRKMTSSKAKATDGR